MGSTTPGAGSLASPHPSIKKLTSSPSLSIVFKCQEKVQIIVWYSCRSHSDRQHHDSGGVWL